MLVIVLTLSKTDGQLISNPDTISRGFVYRSDSQALLNEVNQLVITTVNKSRGASGNQRINLRQHIKKSVETLLYTRTKRRPMILPVIIEI